eukprot:m.119175 g.119175  ORF g.119175 m.119175 type:complete len:181 (+) comp13674_c3_seq3:142-684(+)
MASTIQLPYDADLNGLSQTLMSARNDLIFIMGFAMGQAREFFGVNPTLTGINGRKFADACTSFLLLKFQSQQFQFLEDVTHGGSYGEPVALAERIHVHLKNTKVPVSMLNALEELRVLGNVEMYVYGDGRTLDMEMQEKVRDKTTCEWTCINLAVGQLPACRSLLAHAHALAHVLRTIPL